MMLNLLSLINSSPVTGDDFPTALVIFIVLLVVSVGALLLLFLGRKK